MTLPFLFGSYFLAMTIFAWPFPGDYQKVDFLDFLRFVHTNQS